MFARFSINALLAVSVSVTLLGCASAERVVPVEVMQTKTTPAMRWDHRPEASAWTKATLAAVRTHGAALLDTTPSDIEKFCPAYPEATDSQRAAFWSGLLSALAKHESTWRPEAAGGGGQWIGLTQIDPRTAKGYDCVAQSSSELKDGRSNLSCAIRIAAHQVSRDSELIGGPGAWRGMARDWAPFRSAEKQQDMANWTSQQSYCAE